MLDIEEMRRALAKHPENANAHYNLGLALLMSIEPALRAHELDRSDAVALEAESCFRRALDMTLRRHGRALTMYGALCRWQRRYAEAEPLLEEAMGLPAGSPDWLTATTHRIACWMEQEDAAHALPLIHLALEHCPDEAHLHYKLGACEWSLGHHDAAIVALERSLALDPSNEGARKMLADVRAARPAAPAAVPEAVADLQAEAMKLGQALQAKIMEILNGPLSPEERPKAIAEAQAKYAVDVQRLMSSFKP